MASFVKRLAKCAAALCVLCGLAFAQPKPKAAVYIMGNPDGRDAIRSAVNTFLIKSGKYQMIAVDAIDVVAQEQRRQMSGAVSDGDIAALGRDAGAQYVCVVQRSELDGVSYVATRMVSVQSKVAELADMTELPRGGKIIDMIQWQIGSMLGMPVGPRPTAASSGSSYAAAARPAGTQYPPQNAAAPNRVEPPIQGTIVPGGSLAEKLAWLQKSADSHETYIIEVNADESIAPHTFSYSGAIDITIVLRGVGGNRTIRLQSNGPMFRVNSNVTLILDNNITLHGHPGNWASVIDVYSGTFIMNGSTITGDGKSGVYVDDNGSVTMNGGTISNNTSIYGGGVRIVKGTFTMTGGVISGNTALKHGGGVCVHGSGIFNMRGGIISGNIAREYGGGMYSDDMNFTKSGGTITGYKSDPAIGNMVRDEDGNILARRGYAIYCKMYVGDNKRKETTAGPSDNFAKNGSGAWER
jgi:hypothetical protein